MKHRHSPAIAALCGRMVRVTGEPLFAILEPSAHPERVDHVWIRIALPDSSRYLVVVNTFSMRNFEAGFDPRIRVARFREDDGTPPTPGIQALEGFSYTEEESRRNLYFEHHDREGMECLLIEATRSAAALSAWGDLFCRKVPGVHQIHSRRRSCAVSEDQIGRDGGLTFYYAEPAHSVTYYFKFCGQP